MKHQAAGILFFCEGQILLALRSELVDEALTWGVVGGSVGFDELESTELELEAAWIGARREVKEELGSLPRNLKYFDHVIFAEDRFQYTTFLVEISPKARLKWHIELNWENDEAEWFDVSKLPEDLHYGLSYLIQQRSNLFGRRSNRGR